jgi:hypothetical protein
LWTVPLGAALPLAAPLMLFAFANVHALVGFSASFVAKLTRFRRFRRQLGAARKALQFVLPGI